MNCHVFAGEGGGDVQAPELTGYGDAEWVRLMVMSPHSTARYGAKNTMPVFRDLEGPAAPVFLQELTAAKDAMLKEAGDNEAKQKAAEAAVKPVALSDIDRELIIRWLLHDDRVVFGGTPISGPPRR
jgi:hypothetical protein